MKDRRNFLKLFGTGLSGAILTSSKVSAETLSIKNGTLKVGVLLPQSENNKQYSESFLNGFKLGLNERNRIELKSFDVFTESVKYGSSYLASKKAKQLIFENKVNLIVGLLNSESTLELGELAQENKLPVLIANAGENYISDTKRKNPYMFFNSLDLFKNSYLTGKLAVEKYGKNIVVVSSLFDSGYDALIAFYKGVEEAGGTITKTFVKGQNDNEFFHKTFDNIKELEADCIYVFLNGDFANTFFNIAKIQDINLPLLSTSFATDENNLLRSGTTANKIENFSCWNKNVKNTENRNFISSYLQAYSKDPGQFGFLGYETGLIINSSVENCRNELSGIHLANALKNCKVNSPAGKITVNNNGLVNNPVYLCYTGIKGNQILTNKIAKEINIEGEFDLSFTDLHTDIRSGWLNPYPFI